MGPLGSFMPARLRWMASATAVTASSCPMMRLHAWQGGGEEGGDKETCKGRDGTRDVLGTRPVGCGACKAAGRQAAGLQPAPSGPLAKAHTPGGVACRFPLPGHGPTLGICPNAHTHPPILLPKPLTGTANRCAPY